MNVTLLSLAAMATLKMPALCGRKNVVAHSCFFNFGTSSIFRNIKYLQVKRTVISNFLSTPIKYDSNTAEINGDYASTAFVSSYFYAVHVKDSKFYNCITAENNGGAISVQQQNSFDIEILDSTFVKCIVTKFDGYGGVLMTYGGSVKINHCCMSKCSATHGSYLYISSYKDTNKVEINQVALLENQNMQNGEMSIYSNSKLNSFVDINSTDNNVDGWGAGMYLDTIFNLNVIRAIFYKCDGANIVYLKNTPALLQFQYVSIIENNANQKSIVGIDGSYIMGRCIFARNRYLENEITIYSGKLLLSECVFSDTRLEGKIEIYASKNNPNAQPYAINFAAIGSCPAAVGGDIKNSYTPTATWLFDHHIYNGADIVALIAIALEAIILILSIALILFFCCCSKPRMWRSIKYVRGDYVNQPLLQQDDQAQKDLENPKIKKDQQFDQPPPISSSSSGNEDNDGDQIELEDIVVVVEDPPPKQEEPLIDFSDHEQRVEQESEHQNEDEVNDEEVVDRDDKPKKHEHKAQKESESESESEKSKKKHKNKKDTEPEEEQEPPQKKHKNKEEVEQTEEDVPKKRKHRNEDEEKEEVEQTEEDVPKKRKHRNEDEEKEEEEPKKRKQRNEDEEEAPRKKRRHDDTNEEQIEDKAQKKHRRKKESELEEEPEPPQKKHKHKEEPEQVEEDVPKKRKHRNDEEKEEETPRRKHRSQAEIETEEEPKKSSHRNRNDEEEQETQRKKHRHQEEEVETKRKHKNHNEEEESANRKRKHRREPEPEPEEPPKRRRHHRTDSD